MIDKYNLKTSDVDTGVECPTCHQLGMNRVKRKWVCTNKHISENAHFQTLNDYFLIFGPEITNKEFRKFFHIENKDVATRMLKKMDLIESGKGRWRKYIKRRKIFFRTIASDFSQK